MTLKHKLTYDVKEACFATGLSKAFIFRKISDGDLKSFKIANRRLIHADDLTSWVDSYRNSSRGVAA